MPASGSVAGSFPSPTFHPPPDGLVAVACGASAGAIARERSSDDRGVVDRHDVQASDFPFDPR